MKRNKKYQVIIYVIIIMSCITACQLTKENPLDIQWIKQNEEKVKLILIILKATAITFLRQSYIAKQKRTAEEWAEFAVIIVLVTLLLETFITCEYNILNEDLKLVINILVLGTSILVAKACAIELIQPKQKSKKNVSYIVWFIILIRSFLWKRKYYTLHIVGSIILLIGWHKVYYQNKEKEDFYP